MYGDNYGYRSGLNQSMVAAPRAQGRQPSRRCAGLGAGDVVLDIGSNDATLLKAYSRPGCAGSASIPPREVREHYGEDIQLVADFFTRRSVRGPSTTKPARVITSVAMFYDLDDPVDFAREVARCLADEGIWHFEQTYMPSMLRPTPTTRCATSTSSTTPSPVKRILDEAGLQVLDVQMNARQRRQLRRHRRLTRLVRPSRELVIDWLLEQEARMGLDTPSPSATSSGASSSTAGDLVG